MDDTLLFIPPCCVDRKLPQAVMQSPHRVLTFYTQGDVTVEKFYRAVSYLLVDSHVMVLSMSSLNTETAAFLLQCFERDWISHLVLSTAHDYTDMVRKYLGAYAARVLYAFKKDVDDCNSHLVLYNAERALTLNGPMIVRSRISTDSYTLVFHASYALVSPNLTWGNPLRNILLPDILRHRQRVAAKKVEPEAKALQDFLALRFPPYPDDDRNNDGTPRDHYRFNNL